MSDIAFKVLIGNGYDDILFKTIMLKGEKGEKGDAGGAEIDDSTTSLTTTWSSSKINSEISAKPSAFSQLNDVAITNISDGQMPVYDFTTGKWKNQNVDASTLKYNSVKTIKDELDAKASSLTDLDDVSITNPQNEQGVIYDATTGKWKNGDIAKFTNTASGSLVHITDGADNIPVKSLVSQIVAVESGNGQPKSPDNPYTISGFNSGVVSVCGINLWSEGNLSFTTTQTVNFTSPKRTLTISGKWQTEATATCLVIFYNGSTEITRNWFVADGTTKSFSYNFTTPITSIIFYSGDNFAHSNGKSATITDIQVELGNTPTAYTPFVAYDTYTFAFGQTVYGGHFDNKGNLVVTHKAWITNGTETWIDGGNGNYYTTSHYSLDSLSGSHDGKSNYFTYKWSFAQTNGCMAYTNRIQLTNTSFASVEDLQTAFNQTPLVVVYPLATPITLSITSQDIPTLLGENNIFSNCGDVEVNYYTYKSNDILEFIDSEIGKKNGTNIPIEENSQDSIKDYVDNGLGGKADTSDLNDKQNKNVLNIVKHYDSGTSSDAITDIITEYGKVNMVFAFDVPLGYFTGCLTFANDNMGSGFIVLSTTGRFWVVSYVSGTITLTELT